MATMEAAEKEVAAAATPPPAVPAPERPKEVVIDLVGEPVMAYGEKIKKLTFRKPTGGDIMQLGDLFPIVINWQTGEVRPHPAAMTMMMATLAGVPLTTIQTLEAKDWSTCAIALQSFFTPGAQALTYLQL